jgi:hypothetical protein
MDREKQVRALMDWCRRDPAVGHAQLAREAPDIAQEVRERLERGPQYGPAVWEAFRVMRANVRAQTKGKR